MRIWTNYEMRLQEERKLRPDLPEQLYTFLKRLLSLDPEERPTAETILLGIKTNSGLDRIADSRPRSTGLLFEDLRNDSRISPVDSPRPSPSTPARKTSTGFSRPGGPAQLRLASLHKERSQSPKSPVREGVSGNEEATSPGGSLVLSRQYPSPTRQERLTAPPARRFLFPGIEVNSQVGRRGLKIVLLLLKIASVNMSCAPMAANAMAAYPLLGLAALDLIINRPTSEISIVLVILHVAILLAASRAGILCMSGIDYWQNL